MIGNSVEILGIRITSTSTSSVLKEIEEFVAGTRVKKGELVIFTPNAEFLVEADEHPEFREILNQADINLPDGFGLILASRIFGSPIRERVSGADLVEKLLEVGNRQKWEVGIVGARRGDQAETEILFERLENKYPNITFVNVGVDPCVDPKIPVAQKSGGHIGPPLQIVFVCHGMIKQESWILDNKDKIRASVFIGVGGSLDFLTGFTKRAPSVMRQFGLEWLWRLVQRPAHLKRVINAVVVFPWLVIKEKLLS